MRGGFNTLYIPWKERRTKKELSSKRGQLDDKKEGFGEKKVMFNAVRGGGQANEKKKKKTSQAKVWEDSNVRTRKPGRTRGGGGQIGKRKKSHAFIRLQENRLGGRKFPLLSRGKKDF